MLVLSDGRITNALDLALSDFRPPIAASFRLFDHLLLNLFTSLPPVLIISQYRSSAASLQLKGQKGGGALEGSESVTGFHSSGASPPGGSGAFA